LWFQGQRRGGGPDGNHSFPDLLELHILCSLSNVPIVSIHSSCSGNHFVTIDTSGDAWLFGCNTSSTLGVEGIEGIESVSENAPVKLRMASLITTGG
jgi:alpha-tubulin suppressor-like RCC1 family protein